MPLKARHGFLSFTWKQVKVERTRDSGDYKRLSCKHPNTVAQSRLYLATSKFRSHLFVLKICGFLAANPQAVQCRACGLWANVWPPRNVARMLSIATMYFKRWNQFLKSQWYELLNTKNRMTIHNVMKLKSSTLINLNYSSRRNKLKRISCWSRIKLDNPTNEKNNFSYSFKFLLFINLISLAFFFQSWRKQIIILLNEMYSLSLLFIYH